MRKEVKQMNGPLNRKKHVSGTASQSSMKVSGEGRKEGPVGAADGYQQRKAQQSASAPQRSAAAGTGPMARPKTQPGQVRLRLLNHGQPFLCDGLSIYKTGCQTGK